MLKIIISTILFLGCSTLLFQFPGAAASIFPFFIAFVIGNYLYVSIEAALLFTVLIFFAACGALNLGSIPDRVHIAGGLASLIATAVLAHRFESRRMDRQKRFEQETAALTLEAEQSSRERSRVEESLDSLNIKGFVQQQLQSIIRDLAGTLDPAKIHQQMFALLKETIPDGKKYLVSRSAETDAADDWVIRQRVPLLSRDVRLDGRFVSKGIAKEIASLIVAPVMVQGRVESILRIESDQKNAYDLTELRMVELITLMASASLGNARLYGIVESRAMTDGLTGLFTQNFFLEKIRQEILFARRYRTPMAIIMVDVDHFKEINDTYGHPVGDAVLKLIAQIMDETAHPVGCAARYGGEEFALLLPQAGRIQAKETGERLRQLVANSSFDHEEYRGIRTTVSAGIAVFPDDGNKENGLLHTADLNLYRAKTSGRNRVIG